MSAAARLDDWVMARKAEGHWVSHCPSCGYFFAQLHVGRRGRRSFICNMQRCVLWQRWRRTYGRMPPASLIAKWLEEHGDDVRTRGPKRHEEPRFSAPRQTRLLP